MALLDQNWGGLGTGDDETLEESSGGRQVSNLLTYFFIQVRL